MENIFVSYILTKDKLGYIEESKLKKEYTIENLPTPNSQITTFYDEKKVVYNLSSTFDKDGNGLLYIDGKLQRFSQEDAAEKVKVLLVDFMSMVESSKCIDILGRERSGYSHFDTISQSIKKTLGIDIVPGSVEEFSVEKYQNLQNQIISYSHINQSLLSSFVSGIFSGTNTILALNEIIPSCPDSRYFCTYRDEVTEENTLYYTGASQTIGRLDYYSESNMKPKKN